MGSGVVIGEGYGVASGGKLDDVCDDSTQQTDTVIRIRIENIVKAFL